MERSAEIEAAVLDWFHAMGKGDVAAIEALIGRAEVRYIGLDVTEWWGPAGATVGELVTAQVSTVGGRLAYEPGDLEGYSEGTVGWAAARPTVTLPDGTTLDTRMTAVFRHEAGRWRVAQAHLSVGVDNEEALGLDPPT